MTPAGVILGVDPGTATTGYGVVRRDRGSCACLIYGGIVTSPREPMERRLLTIYERVRGLIQEFGPEALAIERQFFGRNTTNALAVGRTVGVVLLAAAQAEIPVLEYKPAEVKLAVVGYGNAEKEQVQFMVRQVLRLAEVPRPDDAADALALCICHAHYSAGTAGHGPARHKARTWADVAAEQRGALGTGAAPVIHK